MAEHPPTTSEHTPQECGPDCAEQHTYAGDCAQEPTAVRELLAHVGVDLAGKTVRIEHQAAEDEQSAPTDWKAVARQLEEELKAEAERRRRTEKERDGAYRERAHLLAWLAALHPASAVIAPAEDVDDPRWQLLYLTVGGWQMTWHIAPDDAHLFEDVEHVAADDPRAQWDGHTTDQKYARLRAHTNALHMAGQVGEDTPAADLLPEGMRPLEELVGSGLLWLINRVVFHPRGVALGLNITPGGRVTGWHLLPSPGEPWRFTEPADNDGFLRAEATLHAALNIPLPPAHDTHEGGPDDHHS
ncbi:hypothetical protein [Streptomyces sp. DH37]|uniref:hypothetical protein n=1 Tax=Streptomyces sp. DH37 TaxID=3040122 RepID=UPI002442AFDC|nr:hypothetical protein [Streptomyces sp. DH37]MDG9703753.1 hypothetical protein [Streptomyces sp. DH37]